MGGRFNTVASLVVSAVDHANLKRAKKRIEKINEQNRNIQWLGNVTPDQLIPCNFQMGNISISGGSDDARNELMVQNCRQGISVGMPTIIIHEGNDRLEHMLQSAFSSHRYFRLINSSNPYYDPVFRLNDVEIGHFISECSPKDHKVDSGGALYVKALAAILRKRGVTPYIRMFASCPHGSVNSIIAQMEGAGTLTADEADRLRNDISAGSKALADVEYFFQQLELESPILAWKSNLSRCTSISECILRNGIMSIDVTSCGRRDLLALIATEIQNCAQAGTPFRVIVDAASISNSGKLIDVLKSFSNCVAWTVTSPDINHMIGGAQGELSAWLAFSHRAILFAHGIKTCELLSAELGEYERVDVVESRAGNHNIGRIGYHYGANAGFSTSSKRERVVQPEEIETLGVNGFLMLDNYTATLSKGTIV